MFAEACCATEVILFERTTFLVIATSTSKSSAQDDLDPTRYERTSELIKAFKYSCSRVREEFNSLELELDDFTAVLDEMTRNTYVLVVVHNPIIGKVQKHPPLIGPLFMATETAALKINVRMARKKFEELQGESLSS